jgi:lipopolysaccharide/colanic/teichoic acid biosynthesis glycosyltransferase
MKRLFDIIFSFVLLVCFTPILLIIGILIFLQDYRSPFYIAKRVGKNSNLFKMIKFRTMIIDAEKSGVYSTKYGDTRITFLGQIIRKYKLDELPQLCNVLIGHMSFVGPRPNVLVETNLYSKEEQKILNIKPGITDLSSIIFSNEGEILEEFDDPDLAYNQFIRPWKSRLALFYLKKNNLFLDIKLILITVISILNRDKAIYLITDILEKNKADKLLIEICSGKTKLKSYPPPGLSKIVDHR